MWWWYVQVGGPTSACKVWYGTGVSRFQTNNCSIERNLLLFAKEGVRAWQFRAVG